MNWEKIFALIDRVGGKHFIVDKNKEKVYVMMPLDEYEQRFIQDEFVDLPEVDDFVEPAPEALLEAEQQQTDVLENPIEAKNTAVKEEEQFYIEPLE